MQDMLASCQGGREGVSFVGDFPFEELGTRAQPTWTGNVDVSALNALIVGLALILN